jgi:hypothetical protein
MRKYSDWKHYLNNLINKKMKIKQQPLEVRLFIIIGLFLVSITAMINRFVAMPDFLHGLLMGAGIGLEIVGVIRMKQNNNANSTC